MKHLHGLSISFNFENCYILGMVIIFTLTCEKLSNMHSSGHPANKEQDRVPTKGLSYQAHAHDLHTVLPPWEASFHVLNESAHE